MRKWRKMTWVLVAWSALIVVWMVGGANAADCGSQTGDSFISDQTAQDACAAGAGIGVAIVALIGFFGFVFFSLIWFMTRPKLRDCPRCGEGVKKGVLVCSTCDFDFAQVGQPVAAPAA